MMCRECGMSTGHKFSCSRAGDHNAAKVDWTQQRSRGNVAALFYKGVASYFDAELISHAEGDLWQGGCQNGVYLGDEFGTVVSLYPWERYAVADGVDLYEFQMYDSEEGVDFDDLVKASDAVLAGLKKGKTLVHCQAGLNRSGLVAAFTLMRMGWYAQDAIDHLRRKRSGFVLCNDTFVSQLHNLQHKFEAGELDHLKV